MASTLALLGCADDEQTSLMACGGASCSRECRESSELGPCDVADSECQERVFRAVGCVLGEDGVQPPVRIISQEERAAEVEARGQPSAIDAGSEADASEPAVVMPAPLLNPTEQALGLFGLWQERSPTQLVSGGLGYYAGAPAGVTLIDQCTRWG
jgi:hypothetical protein